MYLQKHILKVHLWLLNEVGAQHKGCGIDEVDAALREAEGKANKLTFLQGTSVWPLQVCHETLVHGLLTPKGDNCANVFNCLSCSL